MATLSNIYIYIYIFHLYTQVHVCVLKEKYLGVPDMKQESVGNSVDVLLFFLKNFLGQKNMYFCSYLTVPAKTNNPERFFFCKNLQKIIEDLYTKMSEICIFCAT